MGDGDRRRSLFEQNLREVFVKTISGLVVGVGLKVWMDTPGWAGPLIAGVVLVFLFAHMIRNESRSRAD